MGVYQIVLKLGKDTRELTTDWIKKNISKTEKICYDNYHYDLGLFDIQRYTGYGAGASQIPDKIKITLKRFNEHPDNYGFVPIVSKTENNIQNKDNLYKTEQMMFKRKSINQLINEGSKYLIINSWFYQPYFEVDLNDYSSLTQKSIIQIRDMYSNLKKNYPFLIKFKPDFWTNGPEISVYQLY
jgi:hypothetical protein